MKTQENQKDEHVENKDSDPKEEVQEEIQEEVQEEDQKQPQEKVKEVNVDYKDKYIRLLAEFDNMTKRMDREKAEFIKYAKEGIIVDILTILDHLELSVQGAKASQDENSFLKGIEMVIKQFHDLLTRNGVKPIKAVGQKFDPHMHEILLQEESEEIEEGVVIEELQRGYKIEDKVIRTVKVKIAKAKEK